MNTPIKIVHIDDEQETLDSFRQLVVGMEGIEYLRGFTDPKDAVRYLSIHKADIAIVDIEMSNEDGFWLASQIRHLPVDIIFLSSHSEFAVRAFEACALDFIVKPATTRNISELLVRHQMRQARHTQHFDRIAEMYEHYLPDAAVPKRIFINTVGEITVVMLSEVLYFSAAHNYTGVYMKDGTKHITSKQLKVYEAALENHPDFVRIHRSHIVNKNFVRSIQRESRKHQVSVIMNDGADLEISFQKKEEIIKLLLA